MNLGRETELVEFKKSTGEHREAMESIASMLNKHGRGTLYFGVLNNGDVVGQTVADKTLRDIAQEIAVKVRPIIHPEITRLEDGEGRAYIRVEFEGDDAPYACDGRYRIRTADSDDLMSPEEVRRDAEGLQTMRTLGENMAWLLQCLEAGRRAGVQPPQYEEHLWTNFIE